MSLILDALRKLEREKTAHEPGVLVVGSVPWGERSRSGRLLLAAGAIAVVAGAVLAGWLLRSGPAPQAAARPVVPAATPQPEPSPSAAAAVSPTPEIATSALPDPPAPPIRLSHPPAVAGGAPAAREESAPVETAPLANQVAPVANDVVPAATPTPTPAPATATQSAAPARIEDLRLSAISQREGKPVALINDRLVFEGDSFDGVRVLHIGETEVEVEFKGQRRILRF